MKQFTVHVGTALPLRRSNVDTDQIIPARFVPYFQHTGQGNGLFADWRDDPAFAANQPQYQGATVLVAGNDFGTGSSRESAVWALQKAGFLAVLAPRFGDIFRENALMRGLLPVRLPTPVVEELWELTEGDATTPVTVDLERQEVRFADRTEEFEVPEAARRRLLDGTDTIGDTLRHAAEITLHERARRPFLPRTRSAV
ncbi:3-isopropylmalate dehydratase small subunit [Streptomyces sp. ME02-8801-2C]|uniref:3-isopropylmalate dehydratase small subunit n=1 Tax=Streptomyces sp. ME02-8801-2C TaxID=3028680 RepID=UPI0029B3B625|nr:3-isopropylmalate dehydratase small subunit [Streptomyces sp. ME02-8801-2C]MDX3455878.1 3-isopropylmalate dehydratase small subunit [Streptomyces sp. ME02-8801-2C]